MPGPGRILTSNSVDALVGRQLQRLRERAGLSQAAVATRLELSPAEIDDCEQGLRRVSAAELMALTELVGAPVSCFYEASP